MTRRERGDSGFTLVELLVAAGVFAVAAAIAVPQLASALENYRLGMAVRDVERELQSARTSAVTTNRPIRVRFNCPSPGEFRRVEMLGNPGAPDPRDDTTTRCSATAFPFPASDLDPLTRPNHDGPIRRLTDGTTLTGAAGLEFLPDGTVRNDAEGGTIDWQTIPVAGVTLTISRNTSTSRTVVINGMGRVHIVRQ